MLPLGKTAALLHAPLAGLSRAPAPPKLSLPAVLHFPPLPCTCFPPRRTEEGYAVYSEAELGLGKQGGGDTDKCPFDCDCCF